jgi:hypothetical protein
MFSGFLQTAAYNNLDGVHGLAGWRYDQSLFGFPFLTVPSVGL